MCNNSHLTGVSQGHVVTCGVEHLSPGRDAVDHSASCPLSLTSGDILGSMTRKEAVSIQSLVCLSLCEPEASRKMFGMSQKQYKTRE